MSSGSKRIFDEISGVDDSKEGGYEKVNHHEGRKSSQPIQGHQCIFRERYNCQCSSSDGFGNSNCPSPSSIENAKQHGFPMYPNKDGCPAMGKLLYLPEDIDIRAQILKSAGVRNGSEEWARYMESKYARICGCHFSQEDVKPGRQAGSFVLTDKAKCKSPAVLVSIRKSAEIDNQPLPKPLLAALDRRVDDPMVEKIRSQLYSQQLEIGRLKAESTAAQHKIEVMAARENGNKSEIKLLRQQLARGASAATESLEELSCEIAAMEIALENALEEIEKFDRAPGIAEYKNIRKAIITAHLNGSITYNLEWVKDLTAKYNAMSEYDRLLVLRSQEKETKKSELKEKKIVTTWISGILATNERNNFLAKALDSTTPSMDEKRQHVLSSLNMGYSVAQVARLKSQYVKEYDKLVIDYINRMTEAVDGVPKFIILAFDDDFVHGWFKKFMNKGEQAGEYLKNLTVMTIDFVQVRIFMLLYTIHQLKMLYFSNYN
jgi:hypothetical protein